MSNRIKRPWETRAAEYVQVRESDFNKEANGIVDDLNAVARRIRALLNQDHGKKCRCQFCTSKVVTHAQSVLDDLAGTLWAIEVATGCIDGMLLPTEEQKAKMYQEFEDEGKLRGAKS